MRSRDMETEDSVDSSATEYVLDRRLKLVDEVAECLTISEDDIDYCEWLSRTDREEAIEVFEGMKTDDN